MILEDNGTSFAYSASVFDMEVLICSKFGLVTVCDGVLSIICLSLCVIIRPVFVTMYRKKNIFSTTKSSSDLPNVDRYTCIECTET